MNIAKLQLQLHQVIDTINDREKLEAIYTLLKESKGLYKSMSLEEYVGKIDEARQQIKDGKYFSADKLDKRSSEW